MKKIGLLVLVVLFVSCKQEATPEEGVAEAHPMAAFLSDISVLKNTDLTKNKPIQSFVSYAEANANKKVTITKNNMKTSLALLKTHPKAVMVVANHTIVKITDLEDCLQSRSWEACMPKGEGYIKKGELQHKEGHINNIIGIPDGQKRTLYLFE